MEGPGRIEEQDKTVDNRFQVLAAVDCPDLSRIKGTWYPAVPPLCRCNTCLSCADYFGRTMVANLPEKIKVGVVNVTEAGCKIELFDEDNYQEYASTAVVRMHRTTFISMWQATENSESDMPLKCFHCRVITSLNPNTYRRIRIPSDQIIKSSLQTFLRI